LDQRRGVYSLRDEALGEDRYLGYICDYLDAHIDKGYRVDYLINSERVLDHMPNHLGSSVEGRFYPRSVWVDSVMMYGIFSGCYGSAAGDAQIYDFARRQPALFAKYLQDPQDKLFYRYYWTRRQHTYPKRKIFWGRGNGWMHGVADGYWATSTPPGVTTGPTAWLPCFLPA
jgi:unsaturated rhamnogalacturonyl hydrolase